MLIIDCHGDGLARGRAHGESARPQVQAALDNWARVTLTGVNSAATILDYSQNFLARTGLLDALQRYTPALLDEVRGIAEGANLPFECLAAYNFMDERWWYELPTPPAAEPGCSVLADHRGGSTVLAQNMDLPASMDGSQVVLRLSGSGLPETLLLSAAGLIGLTGVNAAGVALCVNTLLMLRHNRNGLPVAFALRHALAQGSREAAVAVLAEVPHASGQHYAVADRNGISSLECSAAGATRGPVTSQRHLLHTNHPLYSDDLDATALEHLIRVGRVANSRARLDYLTCHQAGFDSAESAIALLSDADTPLALRCGPRGQMQTFGSVVFSLGTQIQASFHVGLPGTGAWQAFTLAPTIAP